MRTILGAALSAMLCLTGSPASRAGGDIIKIGVLNDQTGMNADLSGQGSF